MFMRINYIYRKIRFAGLLLLIALLSLPVDAQVKKEKKTRQLFDVVLKIVDETGTPVDDANVVIGEGITHAETDASGSVSFQGYADDVVTITSPRFEKNITVVIDVLQNTTITLLKAKVGMTMNDVVPLPFNSLYKRAHSGPEIVIPGSYFQKYPSTDIRNALSGLTSMWDIRELDGSPGLSSLEGLQNFSNLTVSSYGVTDKFSSMPFVLVDNMPADLQQMILDPAEIESATLVKGILGTAMYGPAATGGVLYIKTRTGEKNERHLSIDIERGISVIDRFPGYSSGAEYAALNNLARVNSGLASKYSDVAIATYANNDGYDLAYPNADYRDMILKNTMPITRVGLSSSGGNDVVQYYSYIGYAGEGDIIKIGPTADYNRINARQNVNVKINDQINVLFGFYGNLSYRRNPSYGYDSDYTTEGTANAALTLTEVPSIITATNSLPPIAFPIYALKDTIGTDHWYGVSSTYTENPIGNVMAAGYYTDRGRTGASNLTLTWDMGNLVKGLKSTSYLGFDIHNLVRIGKANNYLAYTVSVNPSTGAVTRTKHSSHSLFKMADMYKLMDYYIQKYIVSEELSFDRTFGSSRIVADATYHQALTFVNGVEEPFRFRTGVLTANYMFKDKYSLQGVLNYSGTSSFAEDYRSALFPALGAGWVLSDEGFMSGLKAVNYLKLRAQYGIVGNETYFPTLYYVDRWSSSTTGSFGPEGTSSTQWFGASSETSPSILNLSRSGNTELTWEKRREFNGGIDVIMLNYRLSLGLTYFNWLVDGAINQVSNVLPLLAGYNGARPYINYGTTRYNAGALELQFSDRIGPVGITIGGNATTVKGIRVKYDEPNYRMEYMKRTGRPSDAIFGLDYLGKFETDAEAQGGDGTPIQTYDATLHAGDLKYADTNEDGEVNDLDQVMIGHSSPRLYYGINFSLKYKNFDLFLLGNGRAFYDVVLNNTYFWSGWGDDNYSDFIGENIGGKYPKLTYYKVNNNFLTSKYWMEKGDYFKLQNIELAYTIPARRLKFMGGRAMTIYARGANLYTISRIKEVDPENINAGVTVYPLFRTFTGGIKLNF
jgi:TonB-linked SusC/RagA family outer membrane protein